MGAVTYSSGNVIRLLNDEVVPVQLPFDIQPQAADFNVKWTPALFIVDPDGLQHANSVGFLPPEELIPFVHLGLAKAYFDMDKFEQAHSYLEKVIADYPQSMSAPEAVYLRGVSEYKMTHSADGLIRAYDVLREKYPSSEWARRAEPYRLLKAA
ncbi:MAG: outer membrane protein assembly factor BamD [Thermoleophilia bacterium]|nr:outer membrane protein assembly factor BamD [Thermoleophilia bacterium]